MNNKNKSKPMKWKNKDLYTFGEILDAASTCTTEQEASKFVKAYKKANPKYAEENLGYLFGYLDAKERERLYKLFSIDHSLFG